MSNTQSEDDVGEKPGQQGGEKAGAEKKGDSPHGNDAKRTVNKGLLGVVLAIVLSLVWYLLADRFTPYSRQARIEGYVVAVAPQVAGRVSRVLVTNNQEVVEGQPLLEIDPSQYQIALNKARSDLESASRQVGAGGASVDAARAKLISARADERKEQQNVNRLERLYQEDPGTISVRLLEVARANWDQAKAQITAAQADIQRAIEQMGGDDAENNTILKTALTAVAKAELDLSYTVVKASSAGVITDLRTEVGLFAGTGSPVLTLIVIDQVWINAEFTENNLGRMTVGTPVDILFDALPGRVYHGEVRSIGLGSSHSSKQPVGTLPTIANDRDWLRESQRFPVIIGFDTQQDAELREQLRIGGQASVMAYGKGAGLLRFLGKAYIRVASWLTYAY